MERTSGGGEARGEGVDRRWVDEIEELQLDAGDPGQSRPCLVRRPCRNDDRRPCSGQAPGGLQPDPGVAPGDHRNGAIESLLTDHLARGGLWPVAGGERVLGRRHPQDLATAGSVGDPIGAAIRPPRPGASWRSPRRCARPRIPISFSIPRVESWKPQRWSPGRTSPSALGNPLRVAELAERRARTPPAPAGSRWRAPPRRRAGVLPSSKTARGLGEAFDAGSDLHLALAHQGQRADVDQGNAAVALDLLHRP